MSNRRLAAQTLVCAVLGLLFLIAGARAQSTSCSPAMIATLPENMSVVVFLRGGLVCGSLVVQPLPTKLLINLDKSI